MRLFKGQSVVEAFKITVHLDSVLAETGRDKRIIKGDQVGRKAFG